MTEATTHTTPGATLAQEPLHHALALAASGHAVFPLKPNAKTPATNHGVKDASTDPNTIRSWWRQWPRANIGIALPDGMLAVDIDVKDVDGHATLAALAAPHGGLPTTLTTETTTGGQHLFFKKPPDVRVKNRANVQPGIDVRAQGGYVVAPPSTLDGKAYRWLNDTAPADCPQWLLDVLVDEKKPPIAPAPPLAPPQRPADAYAQRALDRAIASVLAATEGGRNDNFNAAAYGLARLAGAGRLDWHHTAGLLERAALASGLEPAEVRKTLDSAWAAGQVAPNYEGLPGQHGQRGNAGFEPLQEEPDAWPEPLPLPDGLPPVQKFDPELLPYALRNWVADIAERMQCPPDFTAVGAVVALSSVIGARAVVKPKARDDWAVVPNLWGAIVGRPGVMKSPALSEIMKFLQRLESAEREAWQVAHDAWELDCKVAELAGKANEKQAASLAAKDPAKARALLAPAETPAEPTMRRYVVNDATVEKLADLLVTNEWGLLVYRDEIHGLLCSMDKQGQEGARGFYLTAYDGNQGYAVDRILRGESYVPRVCLAMLGGIQPGKVQSYVREAVAGGAGDDGLLQRFGLTVWPDIEREFNYVDRWPDTPARQAAWAVFERLSQLQVTAEGAAAEWRFSPEAQTIFEEWLVPFENEIRGEELHPALVSHLAKWRKLIPALALVFALVDTPDSDNVIHATELMRALAWGEYLRSHAERLYAAAVMPETAGAAALLAKIKGGKLIDRDGVIADSFTPRQVAVKGWAGLTTPDAVRKASELLADYGWLAKEATPPGAAGGRPSEHYLVHPKLVAGGQI